MPSEWLAASKNSRQLAAYVGAAQSLPSLAVAVVPVGGARSATLERMNALSPGEGGARAHLVSHHYRLHDRGGHLRAGGCSPLSLLTFFAAAEKVSAAPHRGEANRPITKQGKANTARTQPKTNLIRPITIQRKANTPRTTTKNQGAAGKRPPACAAERKETTPAVATKKTPRHHSPTRKTRVTGRANEVAPTLTSSPVTDRGSGALPSWGTFSYYQPP